MINLSEIQSQAAILSGADLERAPPAPSARAAGSSFHGGAEKKMCAHRLQRAAIFDQI
jgi:hypothetical protein